MAESNIKAVIFDWGNVIATFDNEVFLTNLAGFCDKSVDEL